MRTSKQRVVLVSGTNRDIGLATTEQLAQRGYKVILGARKEHKGIEAQKELV